MNALPPSVTRITLVAVALALELAHLGWEYLHGGVVSHHILNRADLPAISNWWGALLVPALTWFLIGRIQRRVSRYDANNPGSSQSPKSAGVGFLCALCYGAGLALAFTLNHAVVTYLFFGLFAISLLVPTYRAEYVLGFVLGMTFTFGAVLPTVIAMVIAAFSRTIHWGYGLVLRIIRGGQSPRIP